MNEQNNKIVIWFGIGFTIGAAVMTIISIILVLTNDLCL